ncbi:amidohydrolase family protein [Natronospira sp.]|uniref:amidohydrolase family protein n=1 Tax=Natronospira sp. TaxID=2024970 RepID=UPI0038730585
MPRLQNILFRLRLVPFIALLIAGCAGTPDGLPPPVADHHIHIRSESGARALPRVQLARGERPGDLSRGIQDADILLRQMDRYRIDQAVILSLGYMYAIPEIRFENEYHKVKRENDFVLEQARRFPERLVAFCGISPIADYALEEVQRCAESGATGIKLHLANSDVDLHDAEELAALASVFAAAEQQSLAIVIHLRPRGSRYGVEEAEIFLEHVLPKAPTVPVQLAHLGGGGIVDTDTLRAIERLARDLPQHDNLWFDISAAWARDRDYAGDTAGRTAHRRNRHNVAQAVSLIGAERILFASDWDSLEVRETLRPLRRGSGLSREQQQQILNNRAPYLPEAR